MRVFLLLSVVLLTLATVPVTVLAASPGLTFSLLTAAAAWPGRENAALYRLSQPQNFLDHTTGANLTYPAGSYLLYGGEKDCSPDVWLAPPGDMTNWTIISGFTAPYDCKGEWIVSAFPKDAFLADSGYAHCMDASGRTYLLGGYDKVRADVVNNSVWYSDDHLHWSQINYPAGSGFNGRVHGACVSVDDTLVMLTGRGGRAENTLFNDVWLSNTRGQSWELITDAAPFDARTDALVASWVDVMTGASHLWVMGGNSVRSGAIGNESIINDVWHTQDLKSWKLLTNAAPFSPRARSGVLVTAAGVLLVLGGGGTEDMGDWERWVMSGEVYASFDLGQSWTNCTAHDASRSFSPREWPSLTVDAADRLVVLGGLVGWPSFGQNDIFLSDITVDTASLAKACGVSAEAIHPTVAAHTKTPPTARVT